MTKAENNSTITQLYKDFERAYAAYVRADSIYLANQHVEGTEARWSLALGRCNRIAERILKAPSQNSDEMLLKIRVAGWRAGFAAAPAAVDKWKPTRRRYPGEEGFAYLALASLRDDVRRLGQHGLIVGAQRTARTITSDKPVSRGQK
jgi:hypothetical protein